MIDPGFLRGFWSGWVARRDEPQVARVRGEHYVIGARAHEPHDGLGFYGQEFTLRFHDGREISTNNLSWQGVIPEEWRPDLPDNAVFVGESPR